MPTLEQQLADAIAAQNALTQAVATYKQQLDAAAQAARDSTRVTSINGVLRANNLAGGAFTSTYSGMFQLFTPIKRDSACMFRFDVRGYDYGEGRVIDHKIVGYCYALDRAPDGKYGALSNVSAVRSGNTGKSRIFIGFDANGCLSLLWGTPQGSNYFTEVVVDGQFHLAIPSVAQSDYKLDFNNAVAPAAGANTGFGLVNLIEV